MGKQIEQGRNAEELFGKVLGESDCVAALGACLSVAYAYPFECLAAALPLVSSPMVWLMDLNSSFQHILHSSIRTQYGEQQGIDEIKKFVPLTMLAGPGRRFVPARSLDWLSRILNKVSADGDFWLERRNGERTAELLQEMWIDHKQQILGREINKRRHSSLVDTLVGKGITLAGVLQQQLEERS
jgi:hypothetical protein